jgi:fido (protein-threonine AMPylation protein)
MLYEGQNMIDFEEYIRQGEPEKKEKGIIWGTAIGLQQVDGLKPSQYLIETAKLNIEGEISVEEVKTRIDTYYKTQISPQNNTEDDRTEEADKVSARIAEILFEKTFSLSPAEYYGIHRRLFRDIYQFAGKIRDYNITKSEWVLNGETVLYSSSDLIKETIEYDFRVEKNFSYKGLTKQEQIEHIAQFISDIWQIHAFGEGNTRTTAVFAIKYLRTFGFKVDNEPFSEHSWYFRNALVRANYNNLTKNIHATPKYIMRFFGNLLLDEQNVLKNREIHIKFTPPANVPINVPINDENVPINVPINDNDLEKTVLDSIIENPNITYQDIAVKIKKDRKTVQRAIQKLKAKEMICRTGSNKKGTWLILKKD